VGFVFGSVASAERMALRSDGTRSSYESREAPDVQDFAQLVRYCWTSGPQKPFFSRELSTCPPWIEQMHETRVRSFSPTGLEGSSLWVAEYAQTERNCHAARVLYPVFSSCINSFFFSKFFMF